jgi:hypothetical protein
MTRTRLASLTLLLGLGFAVLPRPTLVAQEKDTPLPVKSHTAFTAVKALQDKSRPSADELKQAAEHFKSFAQYHADFISHELVYRVIQDPATKLPVGVFLVELKIDTRIDEMTRFIHEPHFRNRASFDNTQVRVTGEHIDYMRTFGKAMDDALMKVVRENPSNIVKVNAMRMYVAVCKSGAEPHWPTVTKLLSDPKTKPEIRIFALQAAANLLWAYDPENYQSRRHAIGSKRPRDAADKEIGALVKAVEDCVTTPKMFVPDYPDAKDSKVQPTSNQTEVVRYGRREAIRALAQVRFAMLPGPEGKEKMLYPAYTLARVCMRDPALGPVPTPSECAEAAIGLCNMAPVWEGTPLKEFNADAVTLAVATGIVNFAAPRTDPQNQALPWVGYSLRLSEALTDWPPLFSFLFDPLKPNPADAARAPPVVHDLVRRAQNSILTPMAAKAQQISLTDLETFIKQQSDKPNAGVLFTDRPEMTLPGLAKQ